MEVCSKDRFSYSFLEQMKMFYLRLKLATYGSVELVLVSQTWPQQPAVRRQCQVFEAKLEGFPNASIAFPEAPAQANTSTVPAMHLLLFLSSSGRTVV